MFNATYEKQESAAAAAVAVVVVIGESLAFGIGESLEAEIVELPMAETVALPAAETVDEIVGLLVARIVVDWGMIVGMLKDVLVKKALAAAAAVDEIGMQLVVVVLMKIVG